jgi:hypothetical protein
VIAVVLCISAQASFACLSNADAATRNAAPIKADLIEAQASGPELITSSAAAGAHDVSPVMRAVPLAHAQAEPEHPRRAGPAMLLAALALMSGIALRRYDAGS